MYIYICIIYICVCVCVCVCIYVYVSMYACTYIYIYCMHVAIIYKCICMCVCFFLYVPRNSFHSKGPLVSRRYARMCATTFKGSYCSIIWAAHLRDLVKCAQHKVRRITGLTFQGLGLTYCSAELIEIKLNDKDIS